MEGEVAAVASVRAVVGGGGRHGGGGGVMAGGGGLRGRRHDS